MLQRIVSILPPYPLSGQDRVIWAFSTSGSFFVRSAYWTLKQNSWNSKDVTWQVIWKYQGPQRVRFFLWIADKQRLLTNSERTRRGLSHNSSFSVCGNETKDILHVLRDSLAAKEVWKHVIHIRQQTRFFSDSFQIWLSSNLSLSHEIAGSWSYLVVFVWFNHLANMEEQKSFYFPECFLVSL